MKEVKEADQGIRVAEEKGQLFWEAVNLLVVELDMQITQVGMHHDLEIAE